MSDHDAKADYSGQDIVGRLRYRRPTREANEDAADEIEELRDEIRRAVDALDSWMNAGKLPGNLIMVIERLRSQLPEAVRDG